MLFLGLGMLLGEDGPGGIHFDNATLVRDAGSVALALILLEGGLLADVQAIRKVVRPSVLLATLGVLIMAGVASVAAHVALDGTGARRSSSVRSSRRPMRRPSSRPCAASASVAGSSRCSSSRAASTTRSRRSS